MKYITLTIFLFLTLIANAQLTIEELAYIPSPSGYYNNLIVKGDVYIRELQTDPLNIHSYGAFLDMTVQRKEDPNVGIENLIVNANTSATPATSAVLTSVITKTDWSDPTTVNIGFGGASLTLQQDELNPDFTTNPDTDAHQLKIAYIKDWVENGWAGIRDWVFTEDKQMIHRTEDLSFENNVENPTNSLIANETYILGMRIPYCTGADYIWKPVQVGDKTITVLICPPDNSHKP